MKAIWKLIRTIGYLFSGRVNKISEVWGRNEAVVEAKFDNIIDNKKKSIQTYKNAVGGLIANQERKKAQLKQLTDEVTRLERNKLGAELKAKSLASSMDAESLKSHPDYAKCKAAYRDFSTTLEEKNKRITDLENDIKEIDHQLTSHKTQLESQMRDLEKIKDEKHETKAALAAAEEKKKIGDLFAGISEDKTDKELQELRETRQRADAEARVSSELTGLDAKRADDEFFAYATENVIDDEFDKLIGLTRESSNTTTPTQSDKVAE